ncbi:MAG: hypothetical protein Q9227_009552 [Pyrenula ochraceoflavens]
MERPSKRMRFTKENSKFSQTSGSRTNEGLIGSEVGTRSKSDEDEAGKDDGYRHANFHDEDLRRRHHHDDFYLEPRTRRPRLERRNAVEEVLPRDPKKGVLEKVTNNVYDVIIDEPDNAIAALTLPAEPAVITVASYGALTISAAAPAPTSTVASETGDSNSPGVFASPSSSFVESTADSQSTLSSPPSTPPADSSSSTITSHRSVSTIIETTISHIGNNHSTTTITESSDTTTTTTQTSTLEVSFSNGTAITIHPSTSSFSFSSNSTTSRLSTTSHSSSTFSTSASSTSSSSSASAGAGGGSLTSPTSPPSSSATSSTNGSSQTSSGPNTPTVVGSVIGGVAGLAIILLLVLFFLRHYRRQLKARGALPPSSTLDEPSSERAAPATAISQASPHSSAHQPLTAAVTPGFLSRWRHSGQSSTTAAPSETSEVGFQKLAGRKIAPVLTSGGDQYGGNYGAFEKDASSSLGGRGPGGGNLSGASFYRDSQGFHGGTGSAAASPAASSSNLPGPSGARDFAGTGAQAEGVAVMRPSPARTPVTSVGGLPPRTQTPGSQPHTPQREVSRDPMATADPGGLSGPDPVGRSLSIHDGSRGSRFTERV